MISAKEALKTADRLDAEFQPDIAKKGANTIRSIVEQNDVLTAEKKQRDLTHADDQRNLREMSVRERSLVEQLAAMESIIHRAWCSCDDCQIDGVWDGTKVDGGNDALDAYVAEKVAEAVDAETAACVRDCDRVALAAVATGRILARKEARRTDG